MELVLTLVGGASCKAAWIEVPGGTPWLLAAGKTDATKVGV
jgi:hypothetical protein